MRKKILNSLGHSIAIRIFVGNAVIALLASVIQIYLEYRDDIDRLDNDFALIETSYIPAIAAALRQTDLAQVQLIVAGIKSFPDVSYVGIRTKDADFSTFLGNKSGSRFITRDIAVVDNKQDQDPPSLGVLTVSLSLDNSLARIYSISLSILISNILKTLLIAVFLVILLRRRIINHLNHIGRYLELNDQIHPLALNRQQETPDELDAIVLSINNKNRELREKIQTNEDHKMQLQKSVDEKTKALSKTAETKATLLRVLCHDLSNPLVLVTGLLELLENNRIPDDKKMSKYKTLSRAAHLMADILSNVREMEAVDSGKRAISLAPVDLDKIFDDLNLVFQNRLAEKNISLEIRNEIPLGMGVLADPISLSNHVFNNLLSNALKFSFPGSSVVIHAAIEGEQVLVSVTDKGVGMSDDIVQAIFDPTRQTTRLGTAGEKGTGFGMPIVKSFVEKYGGSIQIESLSAEINPSEHGTSFRLRLKQARLPPKLKSLSEKAAS